jgi:hypothetical protein
MRVVIRRRSGRSARRNSRLPPQVAEGAQPNRGINVPSSLFRANEKFIDTMTDRHGSLAARGRAGPSPDSRCESSALVSTMPNPLMVYLQETGFPEGGIC